MEFILKNIKVFIAIIFILISASSILLAKSKSNYNQLVENGGEAYADQVTRKILRSGLVIFVLSVVFLLLTLFTGDYGGSMFGSD